MGKLGSLTLVLQPVKEKEKFEFKLCLEIDLLAYPDHAEGLGKYISINK